MQTYQYIFYFTVIYSLSGIENALNMLSITKQKSAKIYPESEYFRTCIPDWSLICADLYSSMHCHSLVVSPSSPLALYDLPLCESTFTCHLMCYIVIN